MKLRLYHYWRSSSSWRVRWAFALKGIACEFVPVDLLTGESEAPEHRLRNPQGYVPALEIETRPGAAPIYLTESMAIVEWADELHPLPPLLPGDALQRARIRQLSEVINAGTQPLQNLNAQALHSDDPAKRKTWTQHWITEGLGAYETLVRETAGKFSVGDALTMADLFLIPQCYNALRNEIPLERFPTIARIHAAASATESCRASEPDRFQPKPKP